MLQWTETSLDWVFTMVTFPCHVQYWYCFFGFSFSCCKTNAWNERAVNGANCHNHTIVEHPLSLSLCKINCIVSITPPLPDHSRTPTATPQDSITQIQNYVGTLSTMFAHTNEYVYNGLPPVPLPVPTDYEPLAQLEEKSGNIFKRIVEADLLMASLPDTFATEEEQLEEIQRLEEENQAAAERLKKAQAKVVT